MEKRKRSCRRIRGPGRPSAGAATGFQRPGQEGKFAIPFAIPPQNSPRRSKLVGDGKAPADAMSGGLWDGEHLEG